MARRNVQGRVYLLCIRPRYRHAGHDLGWSEHPDRRAAADLRGAGANLVRVALAAGCQVRLVATWPGTRAEERRLKHCGGRARFCPACSPRPRHPRPERGAS